MILNKPIFAMVNSVVTLLNVSQGIVLGLVGAVILPCIGLMVYTVFFVVTESAEYLTCPGAAVSPRTTAPLPAPCTTAQLEEDDDILAGVDRLDDLEEALMALATDAALRQQEKADSEWTQMKSYLKERMVMLEETM